MGGHDAAKLRAIGDVVTELRRSHPDVSHSSLRFLEREGFVEPIRTAGGHRLYSPADVERVRRIKQWQAQRLTLEDIRERLRRLREQPSVAELADRFLDLGLSGQVDQARRAVLAADDAGLPLGELYSGVLEPALRELGDRWARGTVLVAQEKEVSELARDLITELSLRHETWHADSPVVLGGAVEGERHDLGLRMLAGLLRARGVQVHLLGADVAPRFLLEAAMLRRPALILLSATLQPNVPAIRDALAVLSAGLGAACPPVAVGGQASLDHAVIVRGWGVHPIGGDRLATLADAVLELLDLSPLAAVN